MSFLDKFGPDRFYFRIIMLNNNQNQKTISTNNRIIQRLINISHLLLIGVIVAERLCLRMCVCCCMDKFVMHGKQFLAKQIRGIE